MINIGMMRIAAPEDQPALIDLWQEAFGDPREWIELFFRQMVRDNALVYCRAGRIQAMLYMLPVEYRNGSVRQPACYIYAAATKKEARGAGLMTTLLLEAEKRAGERGAQYMLLCPQNEGLYTFYRDRGYEHTIYREPVTIAPGEQGRAGVRLDVCPIDQADAWRRTALHSFPAHIEIPVNHLEMQVMDIRAAGGEIWAFEDGYAMTRPQGEILLAHEIISKQTPLKQITSALLARYQGIRRIEIRSTVISGVHITQDRKSPCGLMKRIGTGPAPDNDVYMNLMLD